MSNSKNESNRLRIVEEKKAFWKEVYLTAVRAGHGYVSAEEIATKAVKDLGTQFLDT